MAIPREARRITYSTNIRERKRIVLSEEQKAVIVGSILGDAHLEANWSKTNYRLGIRHSKDQEKYVWWTYELLKPLVLTPPQYYDRTRSVWFRTISHCELSELYRIFYRDGKKIIPVAIAEYLANPLIMAVWFMDDGNVRKRRGKLSGYNLNTQSFSVKENECLRDVLSSLHNIHCVVEKNHGYSRLGIYARESRVQFANMIRDYVIPSLAYKIG